MSLAMRSLVYLGLVAYVWTSIGASEPENERRRQTEIAELLGRIRFLELLEERAELDPQELRVMDALRSFVAMECPNYFRGHLTPYLDHSLARLVSDPDRVDHVRRVRRAIRETVVPDPTAWLRKDISTQNRARLVQGASSGLWCMVCWGAWSQSGLGRAWELANPQISEVERRRRLNLAETFDRAALDPERVANLLFAARCEGVVLVTQHLDGVPLFGDAHSSDSLGRIVAALRARGLKVGLYYCLTSFRHPDSMWSPYHPEYVPAFSEAFPERWTRFESQVLADCAYLVQRYQPDVLWFDERWRLRDSGELWTWIADVKRLQPGMEVNDRGTGVLADFSTYEDAVPKAPIIGPWEAVIAISNGPGFWYRSNPELGFKSGADCVKLLRSARQHGARLLLSIAPDASGRIEPAEEEALRAVGSWIESESRVTSSVD